MPAMLVLWRAQIQNQPDWQLRLCPGCGGCHCLLATNRVLPAVIFGICGEVGEVHGKRMALPRLFERVHPKDPSEARLWVEMLKKVKKGLQADEIAVLDAGMKISDLQEAGLERYEMRLAVNFTARRNFLPAHERGRKPKYGVIVRPLPRKYRDNTLAATLPDETYSWTENGRALRAEIWRQLVLKHQTPNEDNPTFDVYAIYDPDFAQPWLLAVPFKLKPESVRAIYKDRWPVEQVPLAAKQMVGAHRQFVSHPESIQRLPELALLAGSILSFLAATVPAVATGFWDRQPKRTPGRFRRTLIGRPFPKDAQLSGQLRKKNAQTAHLPKEFLARRPKTQVLALASAP